MVEHVAQLLNGESSNPLKTIQMRISKTDLAKRCEGSGIKRVAMIAAAGWHHVLLMGNPEWGKAWSLNGWLESCLL